MNDPSPDQINAGQIGCTAAKGFRKTIAAVVVSIIILMCLASGWREFRTRVVEAHHKAHFKRISIALKSYHDTYGSFPPAYTLGKNSEKLHSWRSLLLPFLDQHELYSKIRFDEPWNSPHNMPLSQQPLDLFACPKESKAQVGQSNYFAIVGPATMWPENFSVKVSDVRDGTSNTICLIEANLNGSNWMEPRDLSRDEAIDRILGSDDPLQKTLKVTTVAMGDGHVRRMPSTIDRKILASLTTIAGGSSYPGVKLPEPIEPAKTELSPIRKIDDFQQTEFFAMTDVAIGNGKNVLYCCALQIAWDQARNAAGVQTIEFTQPMALVAMMNAHSFPTYNLSPGYYVAKAGLCSEVLPFIREELRSKFPNSPSRLPDLPDDGSFIAYADLRKQLPFSFRFERPTKPMSFHGTAVESFGIERFNEEIGKDRELGRQVEVIDYSSDDNFIVRLFPRSERDEIILAKIEPGRTLAGTIAFVRNRMNLSDSEAPTSKLASGDSLLVPAVFANLEMRIAELVNQSIATSPFHECRVVDARQIIRVQLDGTGTEFEFEDLPAGCAGGRAPRTTTPRKLHFDKPFVVWLRERQASEPYFVAWIENTELMSPFAP